mgnify:CR=1 FL=1
MKKSELIRDLRCNLFKKADTLAEASQIIQDTIESLPHDLQGDMWIALGIAMNTVADTIENLED